MKPGMENVLIAKIRLTGKDLLHEAIEELFSLCFSHKYAGHASYATYKRIINCGWTINELYNILRSKSLDSLLFDDSVVINALRTTFYSTIKSLRCTIEWQYNNKSTKTE